MSDLRPLSRSAVRFPLVTLAALVCAGCPGGSATGGPDASASVDGGQDLAAPSGQDLAAPSGQDLGGARDLALATDLPTVAGDLAPPDMLPTCADGSVNCGAGCIRLTVEAHCGDCSRTCDGYGCNSDGTCTAHQLDTAGSAYDALVAAGNVYMLQVNGTPPSSYTLRRVPTNGGAAVAMFSESVGCGGLATDGTNIYWSVPAGIYSMPLGANAGDARTLVFTPAAQPRLLRIVGSTFYWAPGGIGGGVYSRAIAGSGLGTQIVTDRSMVANLGFVATSDAFYYVGFPTSSYVLRTAPLGGGGASTVTGAPVRQGSYVPFSVDGTYVYWARSAGDVMDGVYRYTSGGTVQQISAVTGIYSAFVVGNSVYYPIGVTAYRAPKAGGAAVAVDISSSSYAFSILVGADSTYLYSTQDAITSGPLQQLPL